MNVRVSIFRLLGLVLTAGFLLSFVNLHGCTQQYSDGTQAAWLGSHQGSALVHQTRLPVTDSAPVFTDRLVTRVTGRLESPVIGELSGMAASRRYSKTYWAINDSGNQPELFALGETGKHLASFTLPLKNRDWEDMASFTDGGVQWLLVADSGDNVRHYKHSVLHFLKEPALPQKKASADLHRSVTYVYEDGPQNVEAVAVSVRERIVYLISKNAGKPKIYALPLDIGLNKLSGDKQTPAGPVLARLIGRMDSLSWTDEDRWIEKRLAARILLSATSMDISSDDRLAVIGNYRHAYLYRRKPQQSWIQALQTAPQIITTHRLAQSESIAFSHDATSILVGSEGRYAPLLRVSPESTLVDAQ